MESSDILFVVSIWNLMPLQMFVGGRNWYIHWYFFFGES